MGVKVVKEISSGASTTLALDAAGGGLKAQRVWKIVFDDPDDLDATDVRVVIGVTIGSTLGGNNFCVCDSIDVKPDGDSRHSYIITASYSSQPLSLVTGGFEINTPENPTGGGNADPRSQEPNVRKANWSTDVSVIEMPTWHWRPQWPVNAPNVGQIVMAVNPVGDLYDGVTTMQPIVTIKVEQTQPNDPNAFALNVGQINSNQINLGALRCPPRSVMLKGISATPHAEIVGNRRWRGWKANYEFVYKPGFNSYIASQGGNGFIGWDIAIPVSGFNVKNVAGAQNRNDVEKGSLALKLTNDSVGSIANWPNPAIEPTLVGEKSRANVLVAAPDAKAMQRPSAQPVALNFDGTPRKTSLDPLVQVCQVYPDFNMANLRLRLD
jgi:hypothetical protein